MAFLESFLEIQGHGDTGMCGSWRGGVGPVFNFPRKPLPDARTFSAGEDKRGPQGHPERIPAPDRAAQQQVRATFWCEAPSQRETEAPLELIGLLWGRAGTGQWEGPVGVQRGCTFFAPLWGLLRGRAGVSGGPGGKSACTGRCTGRLWLLSCDGPSGRSPHD